MEDAVADASATVAFLATAAPQTRLLEQRRQAHAVGEALEAAKIAFEERSLELRTREEALRRKDLELQDALLKINPMLDENQAKKVTAEKRALESEKARELKEAELEEALAALDTARASADGLGDALQKLQQYKNYMSAFQAAYADEFADVQAITLRNATLNAAHADLLAESERLGSRVDEARRTLARAQKLRATHTLTAENTLARLKARLEGARGEVAQLAARVEEGVAASGKRALQFGQMLRSVANLYQRAVAAPGGAALRHSTADAEVLGAGVAGLFEEALRRAMAAGSSSSGEGSSASSAATVAAAAAAGAAEALAGAVSVMEGVVAGGGEGGAAAAAAAAAEADRPLEASATSAALAAGLGRTAPRGKKLGRAPVFLAQAPAAFFAATRALAAPAGSPSAAAGAATASATLSSTTASAAASAAPAPSEEATATGMDPPTLVANLRTALGLLGCVGSYIVDYESVVEGYGAHQAGEARAAGERRAAAAAEAAKAAEADAIKAGFAARRSAKAGGAEGGGAGGSGAGGGGGVTGSGAPPRPPPSAGTAGAASLHSHFLGASGAGAAAAGLLKSASRPPTSPLASAARGHVSRVTRLDTAMGASGGAARLLAGGLLSGVGGRSGVGGVGGLGGAGGAGDSEAGRAGITAEALKRKRELERGGLKTYFAMSPLPPPEGYSTL